MDRKNKWYRGTNCNFYPTKEQLSINSILHGWLPKSPFIKKNSHIVGVGSCFAREVSKYLHKIGYAQTEPKTEEFISAGTNTTYAMMQLFDWIFTNTQPMVETWHKDNQEILKRTPKSRQIIRDQFVEADVFILTMGLSEVWYNKDTNDTFWRGVPADIFEEGIHRFRVTSVQENKQNIEHILTLIGQHAPVAKVIITLSPVPLQATFRPISCISANSVSKAILRVAIDEVMRERDVHNNGNLYYWPSYEIVTELAKNPYEQDNRHVTRETVNQIMKAFNKYYLIQ